MSTDSFQLDAERNTPALDYLAWMKRAAEAGKGLGSMIKEIASLQFGRGKIQPEEYFLYQLYDDERFTPEAKRTFIGLNAPTPVSAWAEVVNDKPTLTALLRGLDFPIPETQAVVHESRTFGGAHALRTPDDLRKFLREDAKYPIFGKPYDSACSLGTANIASFDYATDAIVLNDGQSVDLDQFVSQVKRFGWKYLLQTLMLPHPDLIPIVGNRVCTVRMFVLQDDDGCELLRASWKIPAFENGADNFWRTGNILAGVDVENGKIVRTLQRTNDGTAPIDRHPLTDASFEDLVFPHWDEMRDLVLRAAPNLPGCNMQGWDVALTDGGPVLVELEGDGGDPIMEQLCFDSGLLQGRFEKFLDAQKEAEKKKKAKRKARRMSTIKRNISAITGPGDAQSPSDEQATANSVTTGDEAKANEAKVAAANSSTGSNSDESVSV